MHCSLFSVVLLTAIGCGKNSAPADGTATPSDSGHAETEPSDEWDALDLSSFRELRKTELTQSVSPTSMALDRQHGPSLSIDPSAAMVWGTDSLFLHDPRPVCIDNTAVRNSSPPIPGGDCPAGKDKTSRGAIGTAGPPVAVAMIEGGGTAGILDTRGQVHWVITDPLATTAHDYMRATPGPVLDLDTEEIEQASLFITPDQIAVGGEGSLHIFDHAGALLEEFERESRILDLVRHDSAWWTLTEENVHRNEDEVTSGGHSFFVHQENLWVVSDDTLKQITGEEQTISLPGIRGPAVSWGQQILAITDEGIMADNTGELVWAGQAIDMDVTDAEELVILQQDGTIHIFVNESTYGNDTKLHAWISAFIEKPRKADIDVPCRGDGETIEQILNQANTNLDLLLDLPAPSALGITPAHWRRAEECDATDQLSELVNELELGVLFHDAPEECTGDQACYTEALQAHLSVFTTQPMWVSGLGSHTELGIDWVQALKDIDAPNRFSFFGMSTRPDVPHEGDIRAKDSWPSTMTGQSQTWAVDAVEDIVDGHPDGWLTMLPGDNIPAFNLGSCANLFLNECHPLGRGNGDEIGEEDIRSLDILLHRALVSAQSNGFHTWNFHLPDIGAYDYTDGCESIDGTWTGDECEGARIQNWLIDVHRRFATRGFLVWATPGTLALP